MRYFEFVSDKHKKNVFSDIPKRSTKNSAGYDFISPDDFTIEPKSVCMIHTDIKAKMLNDEVLHIYPRSSYGMKKNLMLCNTVGVIDSDYYGNIDNDGNIIISYFNYGDKVQYIKRGDKIAQGVFIKFLKTVDDSCSEERVGGIGSTN